MSQKKEKVKIQTTKKEENKKNDLIFPEQLTKRTLKKIIKQIIKQQPEITKRQITTIFVNNYEDINKKTKKLIKKIIKKNIGITCI